MKDITYEILYLWYSRLGFGMQWTFIEPHFSRWFYLVWCYSTTNVPFRRMNRWQIVSNHTIKWPIDIIRYVKLNFLKNLFYSNLIVYHIVCAIDLKPHSHNMHTFDFRYRCGYYTLNVLYSSRLCVLPWCYILAIWKFKSA